MSFARTFAELVLVFATGLDSVSPPSAEELLNRYEQSLMRLSRYAVVYKGTTYYRRADQVNERLDSVREYRVLRDKDRWNFLASNRNYPFGEPAEGYATEFNFVSNGHLLEIYYPQQTIGVRPGSPRAVHGTAVAAEKLPLRAINFLGEASLPLGYFNVVDARHSLAQVFRLAVLNKAALCSGRDEAGDFIELTKKDGDTLRLWIDLNAGGGLKGLRVVQTVDAGHANSYRHDRSMVEQVYGFARTAAIKSMTYEVRGVETALSEGQHVITKFEALRTLEAVDGTKAYERNEGHLTDWNLNPDVDSPSAFQPLLPVPENFRVEDPDEEAIRYVYRNGHVVLDINQPTVEELERVKLSARRSQGRVQWVWAVVAGILGGVWWRMRAAEAS